LVLYQSTRTGRDWALQDAGKVVVGAEKLAIRGRFLKGTDCSPYVTTVELKQALVVEGCDFAD
jgi:hypothetical protein